MASTKNVWSFANLCQYANQLYKNGRYPKKYSINGKVTIPPGGPDKSYSLLPGSLWVSLPNEVLGNEIKV